MTIIRKHMSEVSEAMTLQDADEIELAVNVLEIVRRQQGIVYLFGNGGSHATASHFANDLIKIARIKAVCIGDMSSAMLAYGNDNGWERMFCDPLAEMLKPEDGVIGISCGGESQNVIQALQLAVERNVLSIGMTGMSLSSRINKIGLDAVIHAMYPDICVQEDMHLMVCHVVTRELQARE